jgi:hypothetical protein
MSRYVHTVDESRILSTLERFERMSHGVIQDLRDTRNRIGFREGHPAPIDLADVAMYLDMLVVRIEKTVREAHREAVELDRLRNDVAAVRRVLGVAP